MSAQRVRATAVFLLLFAAATSTRAWSDGGTVSPATILEKASVYGVASTLVATIRMTIMTAQGNSERTLEAYVKRGRGGSDISIQMIAPAFLSDMKFLSETTARGAQVRWIGTSRGVRRVATEGSSDQHLFGSDFTVEDLSSIDPGRFRLSFLPMTTIDGRSCYAIQAVPLSSGAGYRRKVLYVDSRSMLLMGLDYYNGSGVILRRYRTASTQRVDGKLFPRTCTMKTPSDNTETRLTFERIETGRFIPDRFFNIGNM